MDTQIMEVSTLLKHLDELNEEAQQIQNEIHQISNSLTTQQYEEEKTKTLITSFIKKNNDMELEDEQEIIRLEIELSFLLIFIINE